MLKRNLFRLMAIMMVATLSLGFASCGDDDDDGDKGSPIVGQWTSVNNAQDKFVFLSNGNCERHYDYSSTKGVTDITIDDDAVLRRYFYGTYTVSGNNFTITWTKQKVEYKNASGSMQDVKDFKAQTETGTYSVDDGMLTLKFGNGDFFLTWRGR